MSAEPFAQRARTKIVATVGPACRPIAKLTELIHDGVDVFRINMAHGARADHDAMVEDIRTASRDAGRPIAILVDLAGPKIRLGRLAVEPTHCGLGAEFRFVRGNESHAPNDFTSTYDRLIDELSVGDVVMLTDGTVGMRVTAKVENSVTLTVTAPGTVRSSQGINLPGVNLSVPAVTEDDWENAEWAVGRGVEFVSLSFVRTADEIVGFKKWLRERDCPAMVVAKIEKREALENLEDIVAHTDAVMVARGDLGVETDVAEMPVAQKRIVACCRRFLKPVIVATQMLDSMTHAPRPTRAEATDVANAIVDGADACMLSGETAIGEYPRETVQMMNRILLATERSLAEQHAAGEAPMAELAEVHPISVATVFGASRIAAQLHARLVIIATRTGKTARVKSKLRDYIPTIGVSDNQTTLRQMCLFWGIIPLSVPQITDGATLRTMIEDWGRRDGTLTIGDRVVYVTGSSIVPKSHNVVVVHEVE